MTTMPCKPGVRFKGFTAALIRILRAVWTVDPTRTITSANDATHSPSSRHYTNEALDLRVHDLPSEAARRRVAAALRAELGPAFTVLYESPGTPNAHIHIQPRKGTTYEGPI